MESGWKMLKTGVRVLGVRAEVVLAFMIMEKVYEKHGVEFVITSVMEGTHKRASLHYSGCAGDLRRPPLDEIASAIVNDGKIALGDDYDVILEGDHIHVEFQPKAPY